MDLKPYKKDFENAVEEFKKELSQLVVNRASPALLEDLIIDYYGSPTPLKNMAAISAPDARTLIIKPWESGFLPSVTKAIAQSPFGLTPNAEKDFVRVSLPLLSQERRLSLEKMIGEKTEKTRIAVRRIRDQAWKEIQQTEKDKKIREDEKFQLKEGLEEMASEINKKIAELHAKKIGELAL